MKKALTIIIVAAVILLAIKFFVQTKYPDRTGVWDSLAGQNQFKEEAKPMESVPEDVPFVPNTENAKPAFSGTAQ